MPCLIILLKSNPCPLRNWMEPACTFQACGDWTMQAASFSLQTKLSCQTLGVKKQAGDPAFCLDK